MSYVMIPVSWLTILCVTVVASPSFAADGYCDENDDQICAQPLSVGDPAPFAGQLLSTKLALQLDGRLEMVEKRCQLEIEQIKNLAAIQQLSDTQKLDLSTAAWVEQRALLESEIERLGKPTPWHRSPWFWALVGVAGTSFAFLGSAWSLKQVQ